MKGLFVDKLAIWKYKQEVNGKQLPKKHQDAVYEWETKCKAMVVEFLIDGYKDNKLK